MGVEELRGQLKVLTSEPTRVKNDVTKHELEWDNPSQWSIRNPGCFSEDQQSESWTEGQVNKRAALGLYSASRTDRKEH